MKQGASFRALVPVLGLTAAVIVVSGTLPNTVVDLHAQSPTKFQVDPFWPKPLPNNWMTGNVGGTCVDKNDHVFILNRTADDFPPNTPESRQNLSPGERDAMVPAPPVIEFDAAGNVVNSWGDMKTVPSGIHTCYFDPDGNMWIGGNTDAIAQKYTHDGKLLMQIGTKQKYDTVDGTIKGKLLNAGKDRLNEPAGFAVDPANGEIYIADGYGNRRVVVFDKNGKFVRQFGRQATKAEADANVGGAFLQTVHCVVIGNDGLVYVADREGRRIQVFDKQGNFKKNLFIKRRRPELKGNGSPWWIVFSGDKEQKYAYVTDGNDEIIWVYDRATWQPIYNFGRPGHMAGDFSTLHTITLNSKGDMFVGETSLGQRVQKFTNVTGK